MRLFIRLLIASLVGFATLIGSVGPSLADGTILRARARISGVEGSGISGEVLSRDHPRHDSVRPSQPF